MKLNFLTKLFLVCAITLFSSALHAQVTIGSGAEPDKDAVLDLQTNNRGLLLPRIELKNVNLPDPLSKHIAGIEVYNTATTTGTGSVTPGYYYSDGTQWIKMHLAKINWFFMPSIPIDTSVDASGLTLDLYKEYQNQFTGGGSVHFIASEGAPEAIPYIANPKDMYYYVTDYDASVFTVTNITADGIMTYDVKAAATDFTYINIVFVLK